MQVPHFCCLSCGKSVGKHNAAFRRMRMGLLEPIDVITLAVHSNALFGYNEETAWSIREKKREELTALFAAQKPLVSRNALMTPVHRPDDELEEEAEIFQTIIGGKGADGALYYLSTVKKQIDAATAYKAFGVIRPCCKERVCGPPIWPLYNPDRPAESNIVHDTGLKRRIVFRNANENGYTTANVSTRPTDSVLPPTETVDDEDIDNMEF